MTEAMTYCWRRLDVVGLEILQLQHDEHGIKADASIIGAGAEAFSLRIEWILEPTWRSRSVNLTQQSRDGIRTRHIERGRYGWVVDDRLRPDLSDCLEVDVSATPFCNGLALHALEHNPGTLTALYVDAADLSIRPSHQRYERMARRKWRYIDLGVASGFEAVLDFDDDGLVKHYEGLFERCPLPWRTF
jgi:uncharacterized protein